MEFTNNKFKKEKAPMELKEIIAKIVEETGIERIYLNKGTDIHIFTYRLTIITRLNQKDFSEQIGPVIRSILKQHPNYTYRVFASSYALSELSQGNLYFLNNCHKNDLVYEADNDNLPGDFFEAETKVLYEKIKQDFKRDMSRVKSFKKGVYFFKTQKNLPQSAFMMHQAFEQGYRIMERFICGSVKICHSIKNHQTFVLKSLKKLDGAFEIESKSDSKLLDLLEDAYSQARYSNEYDISTQEIEQLSKKLKLFIDEIKVLFDHELSIFKKNMSDDELNHHSEQATDESNHNEQEDVKKFQDLKDVAQDQFQLLSPTPKSISRHGNYINDVFASNYEELGFTIESLLNVCIIALDAYDGYDQTRDIKEAHKQFADVLEFTKKLIPYEEFEFLDKSRDILFEKD